MELCDECRDKWMAWLDYRQVEPIQIAPVGNRVQDVQFRQQARYQRWRDTIRSSQASIVEICRKNHQ